MLLQCMIMCLFPLSFTIIALGTLQGSHSSSLSNIVKPGCPAKCGDVTVPYPFGMGKNKNCSLNENFHLDCITSSDSDKTPKLIRGSSNFSIRSISESEVRSFNKVSYRCYGEDGSVSDKVDGVINFTEVFSLSEKNKLTVLGCDDYGFVITGYNRDIVSGCIGWCHITLDVPEGKCSGQGCCETFISKGIGHYYVTLITLGNHSLAWSVNKCGYAFLGENGIFNFHGIHDLSANASMVVERIESTIPVVLDWVIAPNRSCADQATECKENSECYDVEGGGYRCRCKEGYQGNAYLEQSCQETFDGLASCIDIDECKDRGTYPCYGDCNNTPGSYNCTCPSGSSGDAKTQHGCKLASKEIPWTIIIIALVFGLVAILSGVIGIFFCIRKRKLVKLREKLFEQNGGVFLKQKLNELGTSESVTKFTAEELRKATDNYSEEQIIGRGGSGVVYRGILRDKRVVAVKKSKLVDGTQAEQFINEVFILTQVIHRNVVKLLGCCLEEEVPVLVYEFISNNTLFYHIHHRSGGESWLSWENRLRVAIEAASALGYLHSQATMPIIHRDVKSANILLDDNYTIKVSDFGASRLVPLDHAQVTTLVQGTLGYLDPEYFHTSQLTEKSDVYSFGVVLAELITGLKPLCADRTGEEKNLATYFVRAVKESRLFEIVEPRVSREGTLEQLQVAGDLVKRCLSLHGNDRPTMTEVVMELERLKRFPSSQNQTHEDLEA